MKELLKEIELTLREKGSVRWTRLKDPDANARIYEGHGCGYRFVVCSFEIESQGFPTGSRGYDGAAYKAGTLMRLTRELAELAVRLAEI